jgi:hypothetical protein
MLVPPVPPSISNNRFADDIPSRSMIAVCAEFVSDVVIAKVARSYVPGVSIVRHPIQVFT